MPKTDVAVAREPQKRRTILEAARGLLIERGFQDVALDDVAKRAGVAKGTLFLYYKSKEDLFGAVFADLVERLGAELEAVGRSPLAGRARLEELVRVVLDHLDENRDFMAQVGLGRLPGCGDKSGLKLLDKFRVNHAAVKASLERCAREGLLESRDLDLAASFLFGLCRSSLVYHAFMKGSRRPLAARVKQVVEMFLNGAGR